MVKKFTAVLFVLALVVFTFLPGNEARIDVVSSSIKEPAQAEELTLSSYSYGADGQVMANTVYYDGTSSQAATMDRTYETPAPTPAPTPRPTQGPTPTPLVSGVSNADVINMQKRLIELGFLDGEADGVYGSATIAAVQDAKAFLNEQYKNSLPTPSTTTDETGATVTTQIELPYTTNGDADYKFLQALHNTDFSQYMEALMEGNSGAAVKRLQSRLEQLGYLYNGVDGAYGASTSKAISSFQSENGLAQSGIADINTQTMLFSSSAKENSRPLWDYYVTVDISEQRVYVYKWSENDNDYTNLVKKFKCSTGTSSNPTPRGIYKETVRKGATWHHFKAFGNCWARYAIHIDPTGNIMFHSVLYNRKNGKSPTSSSVRALGRRASHGCIRLAVDNAKWLYENITDGTTVEIRK
ncbi:MAG: L,D-transpeptidase family protein [Clostridia bacterium]|nr:L,D-transpeptidase family protein [Clostridia bacterium]